MTAKELQTDLTLTTSNCSTATSGSRPSVPSTQCLKLANSWVGSAQLAGSYRWAKNRLE